MWWKRVVLNNYFLAAIIVNVLSVAVVFIFKGFLPPVVPLFYGRPSGDGQLIPTLGLVVAPITSLIITFVNLGLNIIVKDIFLKKILAVAALFLTLITTITVIKIVSLVGFF
jgi:hypothetical protein